MCSLAFFSGSAGAQYFGNTPDELDPNHIRYFGSAKDARGKLLADVTFTFEAAQSTFVFLTDGDGRFRGGVPLSFAARDVKSACIKSGYQMLRVTKRDGFGKGTVQFDCVLQPN
jgi:hypothetical protein